MNNRIRVNGRLYEKVIMDDDTYLPKFHEILSKLEDMRDTLQNMVRKELTPSAKKDRELKNLLLTAFKSVNAADEHIRKNYEGTAHHM